MDKFPKTDDPLKSKPTVSLQQIMKDEDKTFVSKVILSILIMVRFLLFVFKIVDVVSKFLFCFGVDTSIIKHHSAY